MQNKGKSPDAAKNICGAMEKQQNASVSTTYDNNNNNSNSNNNSANKFYVKAFLVDDTVNLNRWAITKESIPKNINTFIGKPLILTENYDHPEVSGNERYSHWLSSQEHLRVGTIIDIVPKKNPSTNGTEYHAIIEVTNDNLKQALRDNAVPLYVSPGIAEFLTPGLQASIAAGDNQNLHELVSNWAGVHLAIVDEPAFGIKKAVINETCGGDEAGCLLQLRKAQIERYGPNNCGFCVKKALSKLEILYTASISNKAKQDKQRYTSQFQNVTENRRKTLSQLETIPNAGNSENTNSEQSSAQSTNNNNESTNQNQKSQSQLQPNFMINKQPLSQIPSTTNITDLVQINQKLMQENELLRIKNEELTNVKDTLGERIAALELQGRREKIERIITADVIKNDKERLEKIKYFVGTSIPLDQIEELYNGIKLTLRKASINSGNRGKVPYYTSNSSFGSGSVMTSQSANSNQNITDEETGLTPLQKQLAVLEGV